MVDEILASQAQLEQKQLGLEAGSKPELLAVLALAQKRVQLLYVMVIKTVSTFA